MKFIAFRQGFSPLLLIIVFSFVASSSPTEEVTTLFPGDVKRLPLVTDFQYKFLIDYDTTDDEKLEGFIFQVHSQRHVITLSESQELVYGKYAKGTNIGLWKTLLSSSESARTYNYYVNISCSLYCNGEPENVTVLVAVTSVETDASIPGGCTMTSPLETDPNIRLNYTSYTTTVSFEDGNVGYDPQTEQPDKCTDTYSPSTVPTYKRVQYSVYHKVLGLGDYSEHHMFDAIEYLLSASSISKKKDDLASFEMVANGIKETVIDSYEGDGVVYNVLATVDDYPSTAYVPAVTYSCKFSIGSTTCFKFLNITEIVVGIIVGFTGLFLLFFSHRLFHVEVFVFNSLIFLFLSYLAVANVTVPNIDGGESILAIRLSVSLFLALLAGGLLFLLWFFSGWYLPSVLLFTATAGFLLMATMMYILSFTSVDSISLLKIGYVYFLLYGCVMVLVLIPAVIFPRPMNIVSSSLIGSYMIVFAIGLFVYTSLMEILMRVVKNATVKGYMNSQASYVFELKDIILTLLWIILFIVGIIIQSLLAYGRKPFPEKSLYKQCTSKITQKRSVMAGENIPDERKRLLSSYTRDLNS